jgi:glutathione reductase (NADPH)
VRASRLAASYGARVAVAESGRFGGTCVNVGCIPKKLFSYAAHYREDFHVAQSFGWTLGETRFDWATLLANKDREIARLNGVYEGALTKAGAQILRGRASVLDAHRIELDGKRYSAQHILVATGSWPQLPRRALVVGGGYIGVEFASIFQGLGVQTTLAYRGACLLRGFDSELGTRLAEEMRKKGVAIRMQSNPARLDPGIKVTYEDGSIEETDLVMFATGRKPNTAGLGLESADVKLNADGAVVVDAYSKSSVDSIHAIGDVTNRLNLTPVATAEGMALAKTLFRNEPTAMDHDNVPTTVFCNPNVAAVGLSEERARERHGRVDLYKTAFRALKLTLGAHEEHTFMKLVVDAASQRVLGAHMIGPDAGEILQGLAIAVKMGATKAQFDATIGIHPTAAEEFVTMREMST